MTHLLRAAVILFSSLVGTLPGTDLPVRRIHIIGDLHGDAHCAREWIAATDMVQFEPDGTMKWSGRPNGEDLIVFMGDYIDRGPESRDVLHLVMNMTLTFGQRRVIALAGNHELQLLLDRHRTPRHRFTRHVSAFAHPYTLAQHSSKAASATATATSLNATRFALNATFDALQRIYSANRERHVRFHDTHAGAATDGKVMGRDTLFDAWVRPVAARALVREEFERWEHDYLDSYGPETPLGSWLRQLPAVALAGGTLFVHGGLSRRSVLAHNITRADQLEPLNKILLTDTDLYVGGDVDASSIRHARSGHVRRRRKYRWGGQGLALLAQNASTHPSLMEVLHYRGMHDGSCADVDSVVRQVSGVDRVVLGHTADFEARITCDERLIAADSSLSRWYHLYGNLYCPGDRPLARAVDSNCHHTVDSLCRGETVVLERAPGRAADNTTAWIVRRVSLTRQRIHPGVYDGSGDDLHGKLEQTSQRGLWWHAAVTMLGIMMGAALQHISSVQEYTCDRMRSVENDHDTSGGSECSNNCKRRPVEEDMRASDGHVHIN